MKFLGHIPSGIIPANFSFNEVIAAAAAAAALNRFIPLIGFLLATAAERFWYYLLVMSHHLFRRDMILSLMTVGAEGMSAALEQTSPQKLKTAVYGLTMAAVSLVLSFADLAYKLHEHCKTSKNSGSAGRRRQWEWDFSDGFGLLCCVLTLMSAILHYHYLSSDKQQPIRFSVLPLAFSVCVLCDRIFHFQQRPSTLQAVCSVCEAQGRAQQREQRIIRARLEGCSVLSFQDS